MTGDQKIWVDHAKWSESWTCIETLPGGGQGHARRARRKLDGQVAFLKVVKAEGNSERRVRFFREARAFSDHSGSYPELAKKLAHSVGVKSSMISAMASHRSSTVRAAAFLSRALSLAKACSMGLKSGE